MQALNKVFHLSKKKTFQISLSIILFILSSRPCEIYYNYKFLENENLKKLKRHIINDVNNFCIHIYFTLIHMLGI